MSPFLFASFQTPAIDLRQAPAVVETHRLQLTPVLDGRLAEEEWDELGASGLAKTYLQWEPGAIHVAVAGEGTTNRDLLVSLDGAGDGWLVGKDNLEARIGMRDGKPFVKLRLLDATRVAGPVYRDIPNLEAACVAAIGPDGTIEATIGDPGLGLLPKTDGPISARLDVVPSDTPPPAPYEPRTLTPLTLGDVRDAGLPSGLKVKVDYNDIATVPGETATVRFGVSGAPLPRRVAIRSEGLAREATSAMETPFPASGKRGASVTYRTPVLPGATLGYRIARATITGADDVASIVQASYRIAPPADVRLNDPRLGPSDRDRSVKVGFTVFGNSRGRQGGEVTIFAPPEYRVLNGDEKQRVRLYEPRRGLLKSFGLLIPANSLGVVPIRFALTMEGKTFEIVRYLTID